MAEIKDMAAYTLSLISPSHRLSNARLTKTIYLAYWKSAIENRRTISPINWYFDNFGPFVWDVVSTAREYPNLFRVDESLDRAGNRRTTIALSDRHYRPRLETQDREAIDHVVRVTAKLDWPEFIRLVYSTYPISSREKYQYLDLIKLADEYADYVKETRDHPASGHQSVG